MAGEVDAIDFAAFQEDQERLIARYRDLSLREDTAWPDTPGGDRDLGPARHPRAGLAHPNGQGFRPQTQSAVAGLDPTLDPFPVAESFVMRTTLKWLAGDLDPKKIFYAKQKAWVRFVRLLEGVEGVVGARPSDSLPMHIQGTERLEERIFQAGKRMSLALGLGGALVATAIAAHSEQAPRWVPAIMGSIGSALTGGLLMDRLRRRD